MKGACAPKIPNTRIHVRHRDSMKQATPQRNQPLFLDNSSRNSTSPIRPVEMERSDEVHFGTEFGEYAQVPSRPLNGATVSQRGANLIEDGKVVHHMELAEWSHQMQTFSALRTLPFFSKFFAWRTILFWCREVKKRRFTRRASFLVATHLTLDLHSGPSILRIRGSLLKIINSGHKFLSHNQEVRSIDEFKLNEAQGVTKSIEALQRRFSDIDFIVESTCKRLEQACILREDGADLNERSVSRKKSVLLRLCSLMVDDAKKQIICSGICEVASFLEMCDPLFVASTKLSSGKIEFSPSMTEFKRAFGVIVDMIGEKIDMSDYPEYICSMTRISKRIDDVFKDCRKHTEFLGHWCEVYAESSNISAEGIITSDHTISWLRDSLKKLRCSLQHLESGQIPPSTQIGFFTVDNSAISRVIMPTASNAISTIEYFVPLQCERKLNVLAVKILRALTRLSDVPTKLEEISHYLEFCRSLNYELFETEFSSVSEYWELLELEGMATTATLRILYEKVCSDMSILRDGCEEIDETLERVVLHFSKLIAESLKVLENSGQQLKITLDSPQLREPSDSTQDNKAISHNCVCCAQNLVDEERRLLGFQSEIGVEMTPTDSIRKVKNLASQMHQLWRTIDEWVAFESHFLSISWRMWKDLNSNAISTLVRETLATCADLDCNAIDDVRQRWADWQSHQFIIDAATSTIFQQHHWRKFDEIIKGHCGVSLLEKKETNLADLKRAGVEVTKSDVLKLLLSAAQEIDLEKRLATIQAFWNGTAGQSLRMILYRTGDQRDMWLVDNGVELMEYLEESAGSVQVLLNNRFCSGPILSRAEKYLVSLRTARNTLRTWLEFQGRWVIIEAILKLPEVTRRWAEQGDERFAHADKFFREIVKQHSSGCKVIQSFGNGALLASFQTPLQMLQELQHSIATHLDARREKFPRLYFVDDHDLLDLLSCGRTPDRISRHMHKIFEGLRAIDIEGSDIVGVLGHEIGERQALDSFRPRGDVEAWLAQLERNLHGSLQKQMLHQLQSGTQDVFSIEMIHCFSVQAISLASHVSWSSLISQALSEGTLKEVVSSFGIRLQSHYSLLQENLTKCDRLSLRALASHCLSLRASTERIIKTKCIMFEVMITKTDPQSIDVALASNITRYSWEYCGISQFSPFCASSQLSMCCIASSIKLSRGAGVIGASGGRTEFVKDFARVVGKHAAVIKCSQDASLSVVLRSIRGAVMCNSVCCLADFDTLLPSLSSIVSATLQEICLACERATTRYLTINGTATTVPPATVATFIATMTSMTPSTIDGAHTSFFRPVSLATAPSYNAIVEGMLLASGFHHGIEIAKRLSHLEDMLQNSTLELSLELPRIKRLVTDLLLNEEVRSYNELELFARDLVRRSEARLNSCELNHFREMVQGTFGNFGKSEDSISSTRLTTLIEREDLLIFPRQLLTIQNLLSSLESGVTAVVGKSGSGKSTVQRIASNVFSEGCTVLSHKIFPNTMSNHELFGAFDVAGRWVDGCLHQQLQSLLLTGSYDGTQNSNNDWILLDGTESGSWLDFFMLGVLDIRAHRTICFGSGERLMIPVAIKFIIECPSLGSLSPSVVARLNLVAVEEPCSDEELVRHLVSRHVNSTPKTFNSTPAHDACELVLKFMRRFIFPSEGSSSSIEKVASSVSSPAQVTRNFMKVLEGVQRRAIPDASNGSTLLHCLAFALTWSVGCILREAEQETFDIFCRSAFDYTNAMFPSNGLVFDYCLCEARWVRWCDLPEQVPGNRTCTSSGNVEFTPNLRRVTYLQQILVTPVKNSGNIMLYAPPGTGKSSMLQGLFHLLEVSADALYFPVMTQWHHSVRPADVFAHADTSNNSAAGDVAGSGKHILFLIDDINLPSDEAAMDAVRALIQSSDVWDPSRRRRKHTLVQSCIATTTTEVLWSSTKSRLASHFFPIVLYLADHSSGGGDETLHPLQSFIDEWRTLCEGFPKALRSVADRMIHATHDVFHGCMATFMSHQNSVTISSQHRFSLHHLRNVFQGLVRGAKSSVVHDVSALCGLWISECHRAFGDRFGGSSVPQQQFIRILEEVGRRNQFGLFMTDTMWTSWSGNYEPIAFSTSTKRMLKQFCPTGTLITEYLVRYTTKIARVIITPGSHGLLLGDTTGLGQRFTASVACTRTGCRLVTCESDIESVLEDAVRSAVSRALESSDNGSVAPSEQRQTVLLVPNAHLMSRRILELLHRLLNGQDWSSFFTQSDKEAMRSHMRSTKNLVSARNAAVDDEIWRTVQQNVTVLITAATNDAKYVTMVARFPTLVTSCTIITFMTWPMDALEALAIRGLHPGDHQNEHADDIDSVSEHQFTTVNVARALQIHSFMSAMSGRPALIISTTAFMDYVHVFRRVHDVERKSLDTAMQQLQEGRTALERTQSEIEALRAKVLVMEPKLAKKSEEVTNLLDAMNEQKVHATGVKDTMVGRQQVAQREEHSARAVRAVAENELIAALPEFNIALSAVKALQKSDVDEIRRYNVPTRGTSLTLEAVLTLLGERNPGDWNAAKVVMGSGKLLERMVTLDVHHLPPAIVERIYQISRDSEFTPSRIRTTASEACASICRWVIAVREYHTVYITSVAPRQQQLAEAEVDAASAMSKLKESKSQLLQIQKSVTNLEETLLTTENDHATLLQQLNTCRRRLKSAEELSERLSRESVRWQEQQKELSRKDFELALRIHLFAAMMCYGSALDPTARSEVLSELLQLPTFSELKRRPLHLTDVLLLPPTVLRWQSHGLPMDTHLEESALFTVSGITFSKRWPLLVDPDGVGLSWLLHLDTFSGAVRVNSIDEGEVIRVIKENIRRGIPTIVEGIDDRHIFSEKTLVILHDVLHRNLQTALATSAVIAVTKDNAAEDEEDDDTTQLMEQTVIRVGEDLIPYHGAFSLALVCTRQMQHKPQHPTVEVKEGRDDTSAVPAEIAASARVINFTPAHNARSDLLLSRLVDVALGPLETERRAALLKLAELNEKVISSQQKILALLSTVTRVKPNEKLTDEDSMNALLDNEALMSQLLEVQTIVSDTERATHALGRSDTLLLEQREKLRGISDAVLTYHAAVCAVQSLSGGLFFVSLEQLQMAAVQAIQQFMLISEMMDDISMGQCLVRVLRSLRDVTQFACGEELLPHLEASVVMSILRESPTVRHNVGLDPDHDKEKNRAWMHETCTRFFAAGAVTSRIAIGRGALYHIDNVWDGSAVEFTLHQAGGEFTPDAYPQLENIPSCGLEKFSARWALMTVFARPDLLSQAVPLLASHIFGGEAAASSPAEYASMHKAPSSSMLALLTTSSFDAEPFLFSVAERQGNPRKRAVRVIRLNEENRDLVALLHAEANELDVSRKPSWILLEDAHLVDQDVLQLFVNMISSDIATSSRFKFAISCPYTSDFARSLLVRRCVRVVVDHRCTPVRPATATSPYSMVISCLHNVLREVHRRHFFFFGGGNDSVDYQFTSLDVAWCLRLLEESKSQLPSPPSEEADINSAVQMLPNIIEVVYGSRMQSRPRHLQHLAALSSAALRWWEGYRTDVNDATAESLLFELRRVGQPVQVLYSASRKLSSQMWNLCPEIPPTSTTTNNMTAATPPSPPPPPQLPPLICILECAHPRIQVAWSAGTDALTLWLWEELNQYNRLIEHIQDLRLHEIHHEPFHNAGLLQKWLPEHCHARDEHHEAQQQHRNSMTNILGFAVKSHALLVAWLRKGYAPTPLPMDCLFSPASLLDALYCAGVRRLTPLGGAAPLGSLRLAVATANEEDESELDEAAKKEEPPTTTDACGEQQPPSLTSPTMAPLRSLRKKASTLRGTQSSWKMSGFRFKQDFCNWNSQTRLMQLTTTTTSSSPSVLALPNLLARFVADGAIEVGPPSTPKSPSPAVAAARVMCHVCPQSSSHSTVSRYQLLLGAASSNQGQLNDAIDDTQWDLLGIAVTPLPRADH